MLLHSAMLDAFDHRSVIERIGKHDQTRQELGKRRQRCIIGNITRREKQRRALAVQIRKLGFELDMVVRGARYVARAARASAGGINRFVHGGKYLRVLAHAEIVVAAPHDDRPAGALGVKTSVRIISPLTHDVGEDAVAALTLQSVECIAESSEIWKRHTFNLLQPLANPALGLPTASEHISRRPFLPKPFVTRPREFPSPAVNFAT